MTKAPVRILSIWTLLLIAVLALSGGASAQRSEEGELHAVLINGGSSPPANYLSHLNHLQEMVEVLERRGVPRQRIHIFSADGEDVARDLAVRDVLPEEFWLLEGTRIGDALKPRTELTDTRWPGVVIQPARRDAIRRWFTRAGKTMGAGDRLLLFVTDHGTVNRDDLDNGAISLWREELTVEELRAMLGRLPSEVDVVMVMSQCYSGTFANAMYRIGTDEPLGNVCGFFSTRRDLQAYGCYPEGRDKDRLGHAFRMIDALGRHQSTAEAHRELLITDSTPDVPLRTSDLYMERVLADEAREQGWEFDRRVDFYLAEAWKDRASWEPQIRLLDQIGDTFGTFSPRSLAELSEHSERLPPLRDKMKTYAEHWNRALVVVKTENLGGLLEARPEWEERLQRETVQELDAEGRRVLLEELLPDLMWHARRDGELWRRLDLLRERTELASQARWRLDVRRAALLRMRSILVAIAGEVLLGEHSADSTEPGMSELTAISELRSCEELTPGDLGRAALASAPSVDRYPPLADELQLLEDVVPSWLGVRFAPIPDGVRAERDLLPGAAILQAVYPDSPAKEAGLEVGDIVVGPPGSPFDAYGQLREWTITSPRDTALPLLALRPGAQVEGDRTFEATLFLRRYPMEWPELPGPPKVGDHAPLLPGGLQAVGSDQLADLEGRPHMLFFWATWCQPCKRAVPEVMAYGAAMGVPVIAISDEDVETVSSFVESRSSSFFDLVATDPLRRAFISYGVSGTPTIVLVDEEGRVRHRQVGYEPKGGLEIEGWDWSGS